ncbi:glycosyl hydrolase [Actibacterium sp. MT2.3-13A]|uniref:glycosyl hydrolase n=1 Tax=Actibacterium sp. MT2.3-13A TaxID=2828332 RepID=UPI001BAB01A6|nr:glycosyl hydrolase [Actibacterium sp. MT2.3-13A]
MIRKLVFILGLLAMANPVLAEKAGIGAWENPRNTMLEWIEGTPALGWYYNWRTDQMWHAKRHARSVEFVPMIRTASDVRKKIVSDLPVTTLLGFNEPDGGGGHQARLTVEEAVRLWPKLEARGLRLGSPATKQSGTLGRNSWQRRFMDQVEAKGLRVDFMAVHYYSDNGSVPAFKKWLEAVHAEYRRPIWVTEFAYIDWDRPGAVTYAQNAAFAEAAILMMEKLPFVERHAWFAANPYQWGGRHPAVNLMDDNLRLTLVGQSFERVLRTVGARDVADLGQ